jgi:hypothetical protein
MLSKYTLADLESIFWTHPIMQTLSKSQRISAYNSAQDSIADLYKDDYVQITNYSISLNRLVPLTTTERNTIPSLSDFDKENIKLGLMNLADLLQLAVQVEGLTDSQKRVTINMAQDVLARFKNDYDALGYYQLWYDIDPNITAEYFYEGRIGTDYSQTIEPLSGYQTTEDYSLGEKVTSTNISGDRKVDGGFAIRTGFSWNTALYKFIVNEGPIRTSFTYTIELVVPYSSETEGQIRTGYVTSIFTPTYHINVTEGRLKTSFTTTIV